MRRVGRVIVLACVAAVLVPVGLVPVGEVRAEPDGGPAQSHVSNMGLCSAFLAQIGARAEVNHLIREIGPYLPDGPYDSPGELYRVRAREHPDAPAAVECLAR